MIQAARLRYLAAVEGLVTRADKAIPHGGVTTDGLDDRLGVRLPSAEQEVDSDPIGWLDMGSPLAAAAVSLAVRTDSETAAHLALRLTGYLLLRDERELRTQILTLARDSIAGSGYGEFEARLDDALFAAIAQQPGAADLIQAQAERGLRSARRSGSVRREAVALQRLAWAARNAYDIQRAIDVCHTILQLVDVNPELEDRRDPVLGELATTHRDAGNSLEAATLLSGVCERNTAPTRLRAVFLVVMAEALADLRERADARQAIDEARRIVTVVGDELGLAHVDSVDARVAVLYGDLDRARRLIGAAEKTLARRPDEEGAARARLAEFELLLRLDRTAEARRVLVNAQSGAVADGYRVGEEMFRRLLRHLDSSVR